MSLVAFYIWNGFRCEKKVGALGKADERTKRRRLKEIAVIKSTQKPRNVYALLCRGNCSKSTAGLNNQRRRMLALMKQVRMLQLVPWLRRYRTGAQGERERQQLIKINMCEQATKF